MNSENKISNFIETLKKCKKLYLELIEENEDLSNIFNRKITSLFSENSSVFSRTATQPLKSKKGTRWTDNDYDILMSKLEESKNEPINLKDISESLGRSEYAIECVLFREDLIRVRIKDKKVYYEYNRDERIKCEQNVNKRYKWPTLSFFQKVIDLILEGKKENIKDELSLDEDFYNWVMSKIIL